jgi:hypothetical protein
MTSNDDIKRLVSLSSFVHAATHAEKRHGSAGEMTLPASDFTDDGQLYAFTQNRQLELLAVHS